ncbi:hypothetical protein M0L20_27950, partial [Spirosoma sp. RP8]
MKIFSNGKMLTACALVYFDKVLAKLFLVGVLTRGKKTPTFAVPNEGNSSKYKTQVLVFQAVTRK